MPKTTKETSAPCTCKNCLCRLGARCRCHSYNALLALALWGFGRSLRRHKTLN